jgi:hypothetical protein
LGDEKKNDGEYFAEKYYAEVVAMLFKWANFLVINYLLPKP